jgi:hypothetical protein
VSSPNGLAIGPGNDIFISNGSGSSIAEYLNDPPGYTYGYSLGGFGASTSIAFDGGYVVWGAGASNSLDAIDASGYAVAPSTGYQAPPSDTPDPSP